MKNFRYYLESININSEKTRLEGLLSPHRNSLLPKLSLWDTAVRYNKSLEYQKIIKESNTVDLAPQSLDALIEKIKKEIIGVAEDNIKVLEKLKKRSERASNLTKQNAGDRSLFEKKYNRLLPEIESLIKKYVSRISSDSEVTTIEHSFSGPLNSKGLFSIYIALKTNLPKLGINKNNTKSALKEQIDKIISDKIKDDSVFGTIGKEVAAELNKNKNISHKIKFVKVEKEAINPFISNKSTLLLSEVRYGLNLFFSLGSKKN